MEGGPKEATEDIRVCGCGFGGGGTRTLRSSDISWRISCTSTHRQTAISRPLSATTTTTTPHGPGPGRCCLRPVARVLPVEE